MAPLTPLTRDGALTIDSRKRRSASLSREPSPLSPLGNDSRRRCQSVGGSPLFSPVAEEVSWECMSEASLHCDAELSEGVPPGPPSRPPSPPSPMEISHEPLLAVANGVASSYYVGVAGEFYEESQWNAPSLPCQPAVWGMPLAGLWDSMPPSMLPMQQPQEYMVPMGLPMATLPSQPVQKVDQGIAMNTACKFAPGFFDMTAEEAHAEAMEAVPSAKPYYIDPKAKKGAKKEAKKSKKNKNNNPCK